MDRETLAEILRPVLTGLIRQIPLDGFQQKTKLNPMALIAELPKIISSLGEITTILQSGNLADNLAAKCSDSVLEQLEESLIKAGYTKGE